GPLAIFGGLVGALVGWQLPQPRGRGEVSLNAAVFLSVLLLVDYAEKNSIGIVERPVRTSVTISASPEKVWESVIEFSELAPPTELPFRFGIAYPIRARLDGRGVGA